ncbi:MAG TPA: helix-turn-helix transcriptional regulator [Bacilli bacterium]|nr:helix-turn-helix transcriptional regulator [Bacilli bacterium]
MSELGQRIKRARQARGVTGAQLAEQIGVSANYISELERGVKKNPSMQVVSGMADVLRFPVDYFFGVEQNRLTQYLPDDVSGYVMEKIVQPYSATARPLEELDDREVIDALVEYIRTIKNDQLP